MPRAMTKRDQKLLKQIRSYETYSPDQCVQIWHEARAGVRKEFPKRFHQRYEHRVALTRAFVDEYRKEYPGAYPKYDDFVENRLYSLLRASGESNYAAFHEAGFDNPETAIYDVRFAEAPWTVLVQMPKNYWKQKQNRIKATQWLIEKTGKRPNQISRNDFIANDLGSFISQCYDSWVDALLEAGYEVDPIELEKVPQGFWKKKANRIKYTLWLVDQLKKPVTDIIQQDFIDSGLSGLLQASRSSPYKILREAGYNIEPWEMRETPKYYWSNPENRHEAIKMLVQNSGKRPENLTSNDFKKYDLKTVLFVYYKGSTYAALKDAGFDIDPMMMNRVPNGTWSDPENIHRAAELVSKKTGKPVNKLTTTDFKKSGFYQIQSKYKTNELQRLLTEGLQ